MDIDIFEDCLHLAKKFLSKKDRVNYYESRGIAEPYADYACMLTPLTDEEVRQIKEVKERYGEDFVEHLNEVIDDPDVISDMFYGDPVDIDLETIHHQYKFTIRSVRGETVSSREVLVELSDDDYCKLLAWHLFDSHILMNTLFYRDEELYKKIMHDVMCWLSDDGIVMVDDPFVVTMEEALNDKEQILKENNFTQTEGYRVLFV